MTSAEGTEFINALWNGDSAAAQANAAITAGNSALVMGMQKQTAYIIGGILLMVLVAVWFLATKK